MDFSPKNGRFGTPHPESVLRVSNRFSDRPEFPEPCSAKFRGPEPVKEKPILLYGSSLGMPFDIDLSSSPSSPALSREASNSDLAEKKGPDSVADDKRQSSEMEDLESDVTQNPDDVSRPRSWKDFTQRPTPTKPVGIPSRHYTHTFDHIEAIFI